MKTKTLYLVVTGTDEANNFMYIPSHSSPIYIQTGDKLKEKAKPLTHTGGGSTFLLRGKDDCSSAQSIFEASSSSYHEIY